MNSNNSFITRYICELLIAVCAIVTGFAQLKITLINWTVNDDQTES